MELPLRPVGNSKELFRRWPPREGCYLGKTKNILFSPRYRETKNKYLNSNRNKIFQWDKLTVCPSEIFKFKSEFKRLTSRKVTKVIFLNTSNSQFVFSPQVYSWMSPVLEHSIDALRAEDAFSSKLGERGGNRHWNGRFFWGGFSGFFFAFQMSLKNILLYFTAFFTASQFFTSCMCRTFFLFFRHLFRYRKEVL